MADNRDTTRKTEPDVDATQPHSSQPRASSSASLHTVGQREFNPYDSIGLHGFATNSNYSPSIWRPPPEDAPQGSEYSEDWSEYFSLVGDNGDPFFGRDMSTSWPLEDEMPTHPAITDPNADLSSWRKSLESLRSSPLEYLRSLLNKPDSVAIVELLQKDFGHIAVEEYEWIKDLKEAGLSNHSIARSIIESSRLGPWVAYTWHLGSIQVYLPSESHLFGTDDERLESIQDAVAWCSGICGFFPPNSKQNWGPIRHPFASSSASLSGSQSKKDLPTFEFAAVRVRFGERSFLSDNKLYQVTFQQIKNCTKRTSQAIRKLQDHNMCCHRLLVNVRDSITGDIHMRSISLSYITIYWKYLLDLSAVMKKHPSNIKEFDYALLVCNQMAQTISELLGITIVKDTQHDAITSTLHACALTSQILNIATLAYSQGHSGNFCPSLLRESPSFIILEGIGLEPVEKVTVRFEYVELACMGDLIGGPILCLNYFKNPEPQPSLSSVSQTISTTPARLQASIEDIVDSWGPAILISPPESPYGENVVSVAIGGGFITHDPASTPANTSQEGSRQLNCHFGRYSQAAGIIPKPFNIKETLMIGSILINPLCNLDMERCLNLSSSCIQNVGTEYDSWKFTERQMMLQGGQYVGVQVGLVQTKMRGRTLKAFLVDKWRLMPDLRIFDLSWGLQISLCTGVARRVLLRNLIEEPMFAYIDALSLSGWDRIKLGVRSAFNGTTDLVAWNASLASEERDCLVKVLTFFLEILQDTGVDTDTRHLRFLWPDATSLNHSITLQINNGNLWARVLKDSPSCATFAAVTSLCLEAPGHKCKKNTTAIWTGQGALLSTAVSRVLIPCLPKQAGSSQWQLKDGQQCWIDKVGGDIWVYTSKEPNSDTQLRVKVNRFPKGLSIFRDWQVLRERQDAKFEAEEVVVYGTMS